MPSKSKVAITPKEEKKESSDFSVLVNMGGIKIRESGASFYDALSKIKMKKVIGRINLTFSNKDKEYTAVFLKPHLFRRALINESVRQLLAKRGDSYLGIK